MAADLPDRVELNHTDPDALAPPRPLWAVPLFLFSVIVLGSALAFHFLARPALDGPPRPQHRDAGAAGQRQRHVAPQRPAAPEEERRQPRRPRGHGPPDGVSQGRAPVGPPRLPNRNGW